MLCSRGGWRMEDFMMFVDVFSPFLFFHLAWDKKDETTRLMFNRQWTALRQTIMCCLRPITTESLTSQVAHYRRHIRTYASAVYEVCTPRKLNRARARFTVHVQDWLAGACRTSKHDEHTGL